MLSDPPVVPIFSKVGARPSEDVYAVFKAESIHVLCLGVSKPLNECLINMVSDGRETTIAVHKFNGDLTPSNQIKRVVLSELNKYISLVAKQFPGVGL